jgi:hypothetical protein
MVTAAGDGEIVAFAFAFAGYTEGLGNSAAAALAPRNERLPRSQPPGRPLARIPETSMYSLMLSFYLVSPLNAFEHQKRERRTMDGIQAVNQRSSCLFYDNSNQMSQCRYLDLN